MTRESSIFDAAAPNYRRACDRWPGAPALIKRYKLLVNCDYDDLGLIESVKSFVECVCLTILGDFGQPLPTNRPSLTELFTAALKPLGMQNTRGGSNVSRLLSAFNKLADALSDVRNEYGAIAHGKDGFVESLTNDENRAFLHVGDAILAMLLNALEGTSPDLSSTREPYERFKHLNKRIDQFVQVAAEVDLDSGPPTIVVSIFASRQDDALVLRIEPSRLLFSIDREAFVEIVNITANQTAERPDEDDIPWRGTGESANVLPLALPQEGSRVNMTAKYGGRLLPLRSALTQFLAGEKLDASFHLRDMSFLASLLATADENMTLDIWKSEARQARLKIALRRIVSKFYPNTDARSTVDKLVRWLEIQSVGIEPLGDERASVSGI